METLIEILIRDGVSSALIVVLVFIWREISRISKKVDSFNTRLYRKDGHPIYQNAADCGQQMVTCRSDISNLDMKIHQITNDIVKMEIRLAAVTAKINKENT